MITEHDFTCAQNGSQEFFFPSLLLHLHVAVRGLEIWENKSSPFSPSPTLPCCGFLWRASMQAISTVK